MNYKSATLLASQSINVDFALEALHSMWEIQQQKRIDDLASVFNRYDDDHNGVLSLAEFEKLVTHLEEEFGRDPNMPSVAALYNEAISTSAQTGNITDPDQISPSAFATLMLRHGIDLTRNNAARRAAPKRSRSKSVMHRTDKMVKKMNAVKRTLSAVQEQDHSVDCEHSTATGVSDSG